MACNSGRHRAHEWVAYTSSIFVHDLQLQESGATGCTSAVRAEVVQAMHAEVVQAMPSACRRR